MDVFLKVDRILQRPDHEVCYYLGKFIFEFKRKCILYNNNAKIGRNRLVSQSSNKNKSLIKHN